MTYTLINKKRIILTVTIFLLLCFIGLLYHFSVNTTTGYSYIKYKQKDDNHCFIRVINEDNYVDLECTIDIYERAIVDYDLAYGISYKWSTFFPNKGKLLYLDFDDAIDNRR